MQLQKLTPFIPCWHVLPPSRPSLVAFALRWGADDKYAPQIVPMPAGPLSNSADTKSCPDYLVASARRCLPLQTLTRRMHYEKRWVIISWEDTVMLDKLTAFIPCWRVLPPSCLPLIAPPSPNGYWLIINIDSLKNWIRSWMPNNILLCKTYRICPMLTHLSSIAFVLHCVRSPLRRLRSAEAFTCWE